MASRLEIMLELERRGALPADKKPIIDELRRRGAIPALEGAAAPARDAFDAEGAGSMPGAETPTRMIADERELEGTGLPPGTEMVDVGRAAPGFRDVLARSGKTDKRLVKRGGRYYLSPDRPMTSVQLPVDPNVGGVGGASVPAVDAEAELQGQRAAEGMVPGSAPSQVRESAGYGMDEESGYRRALGPGFEVRRVESAGPLKGELAFRRGPVPGQDNEPWRSVRGAGEGVSADDVRSMQAEVLPTLGGLLGGVVGAAGSPAMAALGAGTGAYLGELQRLNEGRARGVLPEGTDDIDIAIAASKRAGWEALGSLAGAAAYRMWKAFQRRGVPDIEMTEKEFIRRFEERSGKLDAKGRDLLTTGDVVADTPAGARIAAMEDKLARGTEPASDLLRQRAQAKETYGRERLRAEVPEGTLPTESELGESVGRAAPNAERAMTDLSLGGGRTIHPDRPDVGARARTAVERALEDAQKKPRATFEEVSGKMQGRSVEPMNTDQTMQALEATFDESVLRKLATEDAQLVKQWFDEAYVDLGGGQKVVRPLTYDRIAEGLERVRRAKRNAYKGEWNGALETLDEIETALLADRAEMFKRTPGGARLQKMQEGAETQWRELNTTFRRQAIGDFLKHKAGGAEVVTPERITARLFRDPETSRLVGKIVSAPGFEAEREAIRGTMRWEAFNAAKAAGGDVSEEGIQNFVRQNQEILGNFFTPSEVSRYFNTASLMRTRRAMGIGKNEDPSKWFDTFWKQSNPKNAQITMDRLRQLDPQTAEAVRGMTRQRIFDLMTTEGKQATGRAVDPSKFENLIGDPGRAEWLSHVMDPGFATRLRGVAEAVKTLNPQSQAVNLGADTLSANPAWRVAQRAGRVFLGVLSREARVYNSAVQMLHERVRTRAAEAILDPRRYAELLKAGRETRAGRSTAAALGWALMGDNPIAEESRR